MLHDLLIFPPVGLCPEGPDGRAFAAVEHPVLDARPVRSFGHFAAQGVQLPYQVAFSGAADSGVAGHIANGIQIDGEAHCGQSETRGGQRGLNSGMARADDGDIEFSCKVIHTGKQPFGRRFPPRNIVITPPGESRAAAGAG
ncbi:hypothetical protein SDC9_56180 [bioreactor metagenome]|uniref:Uncharacterized protein n=1 Tax=bioreactor metagenome TaxID=1076179 RepID=A0A644X1N0_9ZZZZ